MPEGLPPRGAGARQSFGDVAREVVRGATGGRFVLDGTTLSTHFQPIYSVRHAGPVGDEALLRASKEGDALRTRPLFESLDEPARTRLDWACRALHLRNYAVVDPGHRKLHLNVNPASLIEDAEDGRGFVELVRFYGLPPERVVLEILEPESGNEGRLAECVAAHRALGFGIAMDHFGRGRSNFDRIAALRPRLVKMDRATLRQAIGDTQARRMLPSLIDMLRDTGAEVAIKGIENAGDALLAIEAGAACLQGFHLGAPSRSPQDEALARSLIESARRLVAA